MKHMYLYGTIGLDITADFARDLPRGPITLHIASLGGDVFTATAIANAIAARRADITALVDSVAASAASYIAMAAGRIVMADNALMMIHNPRATAFDQQADELRSKLALLDELETSYAKAYASKSGATQKQVREWMDAETWFTAAQAKDAGLIDEIVAGTVALAASAALHWKRHQFRNAPTYGEPHHSGADHPMKTRLSALIGQLLAKFVTDEKPRAHWLAAIATAAGAELTLIEAIADGSLSIAPKVEHLQAFAKVLEGDVEAMKVEAGFDFEAYKAKPRVPAGDTNVIALAQQAGAAAATQRVSEILAMCEPYRSNPEIAEAERKWLADATKAPAAVAIELLALVGKKGASPAQPYGTAARVTEDVAQKFHIAASASIIARADRVYAHEHRDELRRNEFAGMRLSELCRESLRVLGYDYRGSVRDVIGRAFTVRAAGGSTTPGMGTGNFPTILEDIANKFLHQGWTAAPETWQTWCGVRDMVDFKQHSFFNLSQFDDLLQVNEREEFKEAQFVDAGEKATLVTYGRLFSISRQAIINDDTEAFTQIPMLMGRAAARKVGDLAYGVLTANANMADGVALFHATHSNNTTGVAPPTTANIDAIRVKMARQTDPAGKTINIRPSFLLVPVTLEGQAKAAMLAEKEVDTSADARRASNIPNYVRGLATVISDPRLDANSTVAWYLMADPSLYPTVILGFLNGVQEPFMDREEQWTIDGSSFKVRIDAVGKAIDWRGAQRNVGA